MGKFYNVSRRKKAMRMDMMGKRGWDNETEQEKWLRTAGEAQFDLNYKIQANLSFAGLVTLHEVRLLTEAGLNTCQLNKNNGTPASTKKTKVWRRK